MKSKLIVLLSVVALFIPSYIAAIYYFSVQGAPVDIKVVNKMELTDTAGKQYTFEKDSEKSDEHIPIADDPLAFFMELNSKSESVDALPAPLAGSEYFAVKYFSYDRESVYRYYFSTDPTSAYYVDDTGAAFSIGEEYASEFILSKYALSLYPDSTVPTMTIAGQSLLPSNMSWKYVNYLGEYAPVEAEVNNSVSVPTLDLIGGNLNLLFDIRPDYLQVTINENGNQIFNDQYENIGMVNLNEDTTVNVLIEAKWYESAEHGYSGEANYSFYAQVQAQPAFYLGESEIEPGDFVVLTGKNVPNINDIQFTSVPDIGFTPVFFQDDKYVRALVPINADLPEVQNINGSTSFTFTVTASGISQEINLNVKAKKFKVQTSEIGADLIQMKRTTATLTAFDKAMASTYASKESTRFFDGTFYTGVGGKNDAMIKTGFGVTRNLKATGESYRHWGVDYIVSGTDTVVAVNPGKVIYVGEQIVSGKMVVVDHGWGLKSTYCHMSTVQVKEGDIVQTGSTLGSVGSTGFTEETRLHVTLTVFNIPVCQYPLASDGVVMVDP
nr:M23 family metallopeptidase [Clostridia bacterium]